VALRDALLALHRRAQGQLTARFGPSELQRVHLRVRSMGGRESKMPTWNLDVLHEEASDQVVCVPSPVGARRFDASKRRAFWMLQQANT